MSNSNWGRGVFLVRDDTPETILIILYGRDRWALECLIVAGDRGCTPIELPAPRWSTFIRHLRASGLKIDRLVEAQMNGNRGRRVRYVLRSHVARLHDVILNGGPRVQAKVMPSPVNDKGIGHYLTGAPAEQQCIETLRMGGRPDGSRPDPDDIESGGAK